MNKSAHKLAHKVAEIALSKKGYDIRILNLESLAAMTDYFVIISGEADVHVNAIAKAIDIELSKEGIKPFGSEGVREGRWALLDCVDVVVHIFKESIRQFYLLEKLWGDAPTEEVRDKLP